MSIILSLLVAIILIIIGIPIMYAFFGAVIFLIFYGGMDPQFLLPYGYNKLDNLLLLAVPLFILAGAVIDRGGIADRLINFINLFFARIKGALGIIAVVATGFFGSISGSGTATLSAMGSVMIPRMVKSGYDRAFSTALLCNASVLGLLIPPSTLMILYAWIAGQSVLASFLATVIPGVILIIFLSIISVIFNMINPPSKSDNEIFEINKHVIKRKALSATPGLFLPLVVLGGIYGGIVTPTEAAAISVVYALVLALVYRELNIKSLGKLIIQAATTTGVIMAMLFGIMILSRIYIMEGLSNAVFNALTMISENKYIILLLINIILILIGMIMDDVSAVLISTPILLPIVQDLGISPIHFAAIIGVNIGMGSVTPPTAPYLYLGSRIGNISVIKLLFPTLIMIVFAWIPVLIITTYFPSVSLYLPKLILGYEF